MAKSWAMAAIAAAMLGVAHGDEPMPEPSPKAVRKFEYAELSITTTTTARRVGLRRAVAAGAALPANPAPGAAGPGAAGPGGAQGLAGGAATRRITSARWVTGNETIEAKNYADLASKLKLPAANKQLTAAEQRLRVMNYLGQQGWELVSDGSSLAQMTFKREIDR